MDIRCITPDETRKATAVGGGFVSYRRSMVLRVVRGLAVFLVIACTAACVVVTGMAMMEDLLEPS